LPLRRPDPGAFTVCLFETDQIEFTLISVKFAVALIAKASNFSQNSSCRIDFDDDFVPKVFEIKFALTGGQGAYVGVYTHAPKRTSTDYSNSWVHIP